MNKVLALVGATASGKSAAAVEIARKTGGEIVNADSRQIYKFLDAGTSKPSLNERKSLPHHLYDFLDPKEFYSAGDYALGARRTVADILSRGKLPIVVGGTGLYVRALFEGLAQLPKRNDDLRTDLLKLAEEKGRVFLHQRLEAVDPSSAEKIPPGNIQRVVRALEVYELTGKPLSFWHAESKKNPPEFQPVYAGFAWPKEILHRRIRERSQKIYLGIIEETQALLARGYEPQDPGLQSLGYREAADFVQGRMAEPEFLETLVRQTRQYAKRQKTWFIKVPGVRWIEAQELQEPSRMAEEVLAMV